MDVEEEWEKGEEEDREEEEKSFLCCGTVPLFYAGTTVDEKSEAVSP